MLGSVVVKFKFRGALMNIGLHIIPSSQELWHNYWR